MKKLDIKIENDLIKIVGDNWKYVYDIDSKLYDLYIPKETTTEITIQITKLCNNLSKQIVLCLKKQI